MPRETASALPCRAAIVAPSCASRSCIASCHALLLLLLSLPEWAQGVDVPQPKSAVGGGTDDFVLIQEPSRCGDMVSEGEECWKVFKYGKV